MPKVSDSSRLAPSTRTTPRTSWDEILPGIRKRKLVRLKRAQTENMNPQAATVFNITPRLAGTPAEAKELEFIAELNRRASTIVDEYIERFGPIANGDRASEMFDIHEPDLRWAHHDAVRPVAEALRQAVYERLLSRPVDPDRDIVELTAGGTASGKSTGAEMDDEVALTYDSTLSDYERAKAAIEQALASGRYVSIAFTYRDPKEAFEPGVINRLKDTGRPTSLDMHAKSHARAPEVVVRLAAEHRDDERVSIEVLENRTGAEPIERDLEWLKARADNYKEPDVIREQIAGILDRLVQRGAVSARDAAFLSRGAAQKTSI